MERIQHELIQGEPKWQTLLLETDGASEAAAMLGLSKNTTRTELLRAKSTGIAKEFSDFVQDKILDHGHKVEALARPMAEEILGEELYPATYTYGKLRASTDGLTMDGLTAWEHKQWAAALAASVSRGELPEEHQPQCQQIMMVTGANRVLFMVSDGTPDNCVHMFVSPHGKWMDRIKAGWAMFHQDLAEFKPAEVLPPVTAAPVMALPALSIQVNGAITLTDNLKVFGEKLTAFIERLPKSPSSDQEFADAEQAIKTLETAQNALEAAESSALAQVASVDEMRRTVALYAGQARSTRLMLTKLVAARKDSIRVEIVQAGRDALAERINLHNQVFGKPYMPQINVDFAGVIKGKKTVASLKDAVDTELARATIEATTIAGKIGLNLKTLRELAADYKFLFSDTAQLVLKEPDDLTNLAKLRIAEHKAAEAERLEAEREKIRQEEQAKAQREAEEAAKRAAAEAQAEIYAKVAQDRAEQEAEDRRIQDALAAEESRLQAERKAAQEESDRLNVEARTAEAERQRGLDTDNLILALYERIKADKKYSALAKACLACIERAQRRAA